MKLGIDFGTSFSGAAVRYNGQSIYLVPPGEYGIPSLFYYDEWDGILTGAAAECAGVGCYAKNLRREIKMELNSFFKADGRVFSGKQIAGYIIGNVKDTALSIARTKLIPDDIEGVVVAVPAGFTHNEKVLTKQAAELEAALDGPGLNVLGIIKEPVAAALAYYTASLADGTRILVYDLGGGTCDVALVDADSALREKYAVVDSDMIRVGGKNWDAKLMEFFEYQVKKMKGITIAADDSASREKLKREAVKVKHELTKRDKMRVSLDIGGEMLSFPFTRENFNKLTNELLEETVELARSILSRNESESVSEIICVGGSCNMPQVQKGLANAFPDMNIRVFEPENAIAVGAAIFAESIDVSEPVPLVSDIASYSYGIRMYEDYDSDPEKLIIKNIIKRGEKLPFTGCIDAATVEDNCQSVSLKVFETSIKDSSFDFQRVKDKEPILSVSLDLPENSPKHTPIKCYITLTNDGIIEVVGEDQSGRREKASMEIIH